MSDITQVFDLVLKYCGVDDRRAFAMTTMDNYAEWTGIRLINGVPVAYLQALIFLHSEFDFDGLLCNPQLIRFIKVNYCVGSFNTVYAMFNRAAEIATADV